MMRTEQDQFYWDCRGGLPCWGGCPICPPPRPAPLGGVQAQLQGADRVLMGEGRSILFDTVLNQSNPDIRYNCGTGEFSLPPGRTYFVSWWVSVDGTENSGGVAFAAAVNGEVVSAATAPHVTCQVAGSALVTALDAPQALTIVNVSGNTVRYADAPVQANVVIFALTP